MMKEMQADDFIVSKTDLKGRITYVNQIFMAMAEFNEEELLGKPHNIIRHPDMPKAVFKLLWEMIQNDDEIFAYVLNKTKNANNYWVFANITASYNEKNKKVGYYSVRRQPNKEALKTVSLLYSKMIQAEKSGGVDAGTKVLTDLLTEKGIGYNEFIISLQK